MACKKCCQTDPDVFYITIGSRGICDICGLQTVLGCATGTHLYKAVWRCRHCHPNKERCTKRMGHERSHENGQLTWDSRPDAWERLLAVDL